ncbi:hypothetical protein Btru_012712 [Bulinus truncatus]|nr:hypothetical protein Btru_012712 [Bulinus truncatus]
MHNNVLHLEIGYTDAIDHNREGRCIYEVSGLKPGSSYRFRIIAFNIYGAGPASIASALYKVPDAAPIAIVTGIREGWGPVGILALEWDPLPGEDLTGDNVGYRIYYRKNSTTLNEKWLVGEVLGNDNKFAGTIGADNYYLEYEIKIAAFNDEGQGPNSSVTIVMSQGDMPLGAATNVYVESYNATAVMVRWTAIPLIREYIRGRVVGYGINYWMPGEGMDSSNVYCHEDCGSEILVGLEPDSNYWVNVQVFTTAGMGTLSEDSYGSTFAFPPRFYPKYVHVRSYKGNAVFAYWKGVSNGRSEEPIIGYKLRWWPSTENIHKANITVVPEKKTTALIHGVRSGIVYSLRVMAYSNGGDGVNSPTTYFTLEGQVMYNPETTEILNLSTDFVGSKILLIISTSFLQYFFIVVFYHNCPVNWVKAINSCYYFYFQPARNFENARQICQVQGAQLLTVDSQEEFTFISDWLTRNDHRKPRGPEMFSDRPSVVTGLHTTCQNGCSASMLQLFGAVRLLRATTGCHSVAVLQVMTAG